MRIKTTLFLLILSIAGFAQNQVPEISNVSLSAPWGTGQVIVNYDLADAESDDVDVKIAFSNDGGENFVVVTGTTTGDVGFPITPGTGKQIIWNYDTVSNVLDYSIRLVADDRQVPTIQSIVDQVDSVRLRNDLLMLQGVRHFQAAPAFLESRKDSIENRMNYYGIPTYRQNFDRSGYLGQNIISKKAGLGEEQTTFIIDAHFDSVEDAPGADDNGSGVVGFLEALRVLAPYNFERSIRFIGFDFEETYNFVGLYGSNQYVYNEIPDWEEIAGVVNFEMIGYYSNEPNTQQIPGGFNVLFPDQYNAVITDSSRGNFIVNCGDTESEAFIDAFDSLSTVHVPSLKKISIALPGNGIVALDFRRSDHANFWDIDVPALLITDGANFRNHDYHTVNDTVGNLNFTFMADVVKASVATVATLAGLQHSSFYDTGNIPAAVPESNFNCGVEVFPNPVKNKLTLKTGDCFSSGFNFTVVDIQGRIVKSERVSGNSQMEIDFEKVPSGNYFVVLEDGGKRAVKKVVVE